MYTCELVCDRPALLRGLKASSRCLVEVFGVLDAYVFSSFSLCLSLTHPHPHPHPHTLSISPAQRPRLLAHFSPASVGAQGGGFIEEWRKVSNGL